jgi:signal transduction histidine kinase
MADRNRLNQAYGNMLDNAIKYSKHGGNIGIRIRREDDQTIIEISDNGIGIDRAEQSRVFERFYRSPSIQDEIEGLGLGLTVARSVIEQHQGRIWVTSAMGIGSTITTVIPLLLDEIREQ